MVKDKSFPYYSASCEEARFDFEDRSKSYSFNGPDENPESKRRKRVASYNKLWKSPRILKWFAQHFCQLLFKMKNDVVEFFIDQGTGTKMAIGTGSNLEIAGLDQHRGPKVTQSSTMVDSMKNPIMHLGILQTCRSTRMAKKSDSNSD